MRRGPETTFYQICITILLLRSIELELLRFEFSLKWLKWLKRPQIRFEYAYFTAKSYFIRVFFNTKIMTSVRHLRKIYQPKSSLAKLFSSLITPRLDAKFLAMRLTWLVCAA